MTLTYTDAYGQAWTTMPIAVGGDLEYDLRISGGTGGCSLKYMSATLTSEKFRNTGDLTATKSDFGATEFGVPGVLAGAMTTSDCDELSAAAMEALLEQNGAVKNVKVTKYGTRTRALRDSTSASETSTSRTRMTAWRSESSP
jgi:hypothetical protein